jgi:folylpolyglutamate synthase/dihydropteroate synthase
MFTPSLTVSTKLEYNHLQVISSTPDSISDHKADICQPGITALSIYQQTDFSHYFKKNISGVIPI